MVVCLNKKISIAVVFTENGIKPVWFLFDNNKIVIKKIYYRWKEREGSDVIYKYTVTDGNNTYEISYSSIKVCWYLIAVDEATNEEWG